MALIILPTQAKPNTTQRVTLDGRTYTLGLRFNSREGMWYISLSDAQGLLLAPTKLVAGPPLLRYLRGPRKPPGELIAMDRSGHLGNAGLADLGTRVVLAYVNKDEALVNALVDTVSTPIVGV